MHLGSLVIFWNLAKPHFRLCPGLSKQSTLHKYIPVTEEILRRTFTFVIHVFFWLSKLTFTQKDPHGIQAVTVMKWHFNEINAKLFYSKQGNTFILTNPLSLFNPRQQLSPTEPLVHSPSPASTDYVFLRLSMWCPCLIIVLITRFAVSEHCLSLSYYYGSLKLLWNNAQCQREKRVGRPRFVIDASYSENHCLSSSFFSFFQDYKWA